MLADGRNSGPEPSLRADAVRTACIGSGLRDQAGPLRMVPRAFGLTARGLPECWSARWGSRAWPIRSLRQRCLCDSCGTAPNTAATTWQVASTGNVPRCPTVGSGGSTTVGGGPTFVSGSRGVRHRLSLQPGLVRSLLCERSLSLACIRLPTGGTSPQNAVEAGGGRCLTGASQRQSSSA